METGGGQCSFAAGDDCNPTPPPPPVSPPPAVMPPPTPPPSTDGLVRGTQVLANSEFSSAKDGWRTYTGTFSVNNGIAYQPANPGGTFPHFGQGIEPVGPGQTIIMKARVRAGPQVASTSHNNGCGFGLDFREYKTGNYALIGTLNGPATKNQAWTIITQTFTVPTRNRADASLPSSSYSVIDEATGAVLQSSTIGGSRWGRSSNSDNGLYDPRGNSPQYYMNNDYPSKMNVVEWNHDWFNTMQYCEYDWIRMEIR